MPEKTVQAAVRFAVLRPDAHADAPYPAFHDRALGFVKSIEAIREALAREIASNVAFMFINTRLILRTGVDLVCP